jgi:DNA-binding winged helix-turn-helix (wHTH) protein
VGADGGRPHPADPSKIEIHGHNFIETVRNVGYRLVPEARKDEVDED